LASANNIAGGTNQGDAFFNLCGTCGMNHSTPPAVAPSSLATVVLIHGWGSNPLFMALLSRRLTRLGYRTVNWGYWSIGRTIEFHGSEFHGLLTTLSQREPEQPLHLVTHSMGGIVARQALTLGRPESLQRMVMLAPPNRGSPWANWLGPLVRPLGRTLDQLATGPQSFVNQLPEPSDVEIGIIAAGSDLLVPSANTRLTTGHDFCIAPRAIHSGVLFRRSVVTQVDHFLRTGRFLSATAA
jgi:pimeloyl-ACP methyl ester carboxylesterase